MNNTASGATKNKDEKSPRINMAFKPEVYEYIKTMSKVRGQTMTQFVNHVLMLSMEENAEIYKKALEFREMI